MVEKYEVTSGWGAAKLKHKGDALQALGLLGHYHNLDIDKSVVESELDQ